ncbi:hypothetical protein C8R47DRAFT_518539 [Mycena vitilis]|nr:hypothetical protein C8R47DRAFT_518539 [Mycena vitilis]
MPPKSESELLARIDELSLDVDAQKHILRDLENKRSKARIELNSIRDPLAGLAVELAAQIFLHCLPTAAPKPDPRAVPMMLLSVCHLWHNIAVSTPELWTRIRIDSSPTTEFDSERCEVWLGRTLALPLSFAIHGVSDPDIGTLVEQYGDRLKNLELVLSDSGDLTWIEGPLPALTAMNIAAQTNDSGDAEFSFHASQCVKLLRAAPRLRECDLDEVFYEDDPQSVLGAHTKPSIHTSLQHLRLGQPSSRALNDSHHSSAYILRCLTLPSLKSLDVADFDIKSSEFVAFLKRSSQPLESLRMIASTIRVNHFKFMPRLVELELWRAGADHSEEKNDEYLPPFLEGLGTAQDFLPNLRMLRIRGFFPRDYKPLIVALKHRHGKLQSFQLIFPSYYDDLEPVEDGVAIPALRQLAADGMHIHIGPKERNFI